MTAAIGQPVDAGVVGLAMTTSTAVVGVGVGPVGPGPGAGGPAGVVSREIATDRRHAEELTPIVATVLAEAGVTPDQIEVLVVDSGPGRFTGLRVGLATAKGLAVALRVPVVVLTSLEILAGGEPDRPVVAVVDARRRVGYQPRFDDGSGVDADDRVAAGARVGLPADRAPAARGVPVVGDGADRYADLYGGSNGATVRTGRSPSPAVMLRLAAGRVARAGAEVLPQYLRQPDVTINIRTRPADLGSGSPPVASSPVARPAEVAPDEERNGGA
ncbi:MAG: tRNA (adenosine(37)-N6)-threonylcarbamoyltransferase complex dimerization subunit type 1 TsaB [Acidimicrobiales bacterium]